MLAGFGCARPALRVPAVLLTEATAQHAADRADTGHGGAVTDAFLQQTVADLPAEDARLLALVILDPGLHLGRGDPGLAAADHARTDAARLLVALQDLADAPVRHP